MGTKWHAPTYSGTRTENAESIKRRPNNFVKSFETNFPTRMNAWSFFSNVRNMQELEKVCFLPHEWQKDDFYKRQIRGVLATTSHPLICNDDFKHVLGTVEKHEIAWKVTEQRDPWYTRLPLSSLPDFIPLPHGAVVRDDRHNVISHALKKDAAVALFHPSECRIPKYIGLKWARTWTRSSNDTSARFAFWLTAGSEELLRQEYVMAIQMLTCTNDTTEHRPSSFHMGNYVDLSLNTISSGLMSLEINYAKRRPQSNESLPWYSPTRLQLLAFIADSFLLRAIGPTRMVVS